MSSARARTPGQVLAIGGGAVVTAMLVAFGGFHVLDIATSTSRHEHTTYTTPIRHIVVDAAGTVVIDGRPGNAVTVDSEISESIRHAAAHASVSGDTLNLSGGCRGFPLGRCSVSYHIQVPSTVDITARTRSGKLIASDMNADVSLQAQSGEVAAYHVRGAVSLTTQYGPVNVAGASGGPVRLRAQSGRISASDVSAPDVDARTVSGGVFIGLKATPHNVQAHATSGRVTVLVPRNDARYQLHMRTSSGRTDSEGVQTSRTAPHVIDASTVSGGVVIDYND
jgi:hypothetical protein